MQDLSMNDYLEVERTSFEALFFHTPFCGTCALGEQMLKVVEATFTPSDSDLAFYSCRVSEWQPLVQEWQIKSVPALVLLKNGELEAVHYAFHSVPFLFDVIQGFIGGNR